MPMPILDPSRYVEAVLSDPSHKLPLPDRGGRLFLAEGETVDSYDPFYAVLLADGSLKRKPAPAAPEPIEAPPAQDAPSGADQPHP